MTVEELVKLLSRFDPTAPVRLADAAGQFDVTRYDIEALHEADAPGGSAVCFFARDTPCMRPVRPEMKCPACGWVHVAIPRHHAEQSVLDALREHRQDRCLADQALQRYFRCFRCGEATDAFVPAGPCDAPVGCTLQPVVVGQRKESRD